MRRRPHDSVPLLEAALAAGADPNEFVREHGGEGTEWHGKLWTVLGLACKFGNVAAVRALLAAGACPDTPSNGGDVRPLILAFYSVQAAAVHALLESGASLDLVAGADTSLMYLAAVHFSEPSVVRALLARGLSARERPPGTQRLQPVCYAIMHGGADMVTTLLDAGAAPDALAGAVFSPGGEPVLPLHLACSCDWGGRGTVTALLTHASTAAAAAAELNATDSGGATPLLHAARKGHGALVSELLRAGADPTYCGALVLRLMRRSGSKPRNKGHDRSVEHATALSALERAATAAVRAAASARRPPPLAGTIECDSDGELNHPGTMILAALGPDRSGFDGGLGGHSAQVARAARSRLGPPISSSSSGKAIP